MQRLRVGALGPDRFLRVLQGVTVLTESEVQRSFRKIFKDAQIDEAAFERAETLIEELRPESPLRFKMSTELEELRRIYAAKTAT